MPPKASKKPLGSNPCDTACTGRDEPSCLAMAFAETMAASAADLAELTPSHVYSWAILGPFTATWPCVHTYTSSSNSVYSCCGDSCFVEPSAVTSYIVFRKVFDLGLVILHAVITACVSIVKAPFDVGHELNDDTSNRSASVSGSFSGLKEPFAWLSVSHSSLTKFWRRLWATGQTIALVSR